MRLSRLMIFAAALSLLAPGAALARPDEPRAAAPPAAEPPPTAPSPEAPSPFDDEVARKHYEDGQAAAAKGDHLAAYQSFRAGHAVEPHPLLLGAMGEAAHRAGKLREAVDYITRFLSAMPASTPAEARAAAQKTLDEARARCGTVAVTAPAGALVLVDGAVVGKAPLGGDVYVDPGRREIEAHLGKDIARAVITVEQGKGAPVTLAFSAPSTSARPTVTVAVPPPEGPRRAVLVGGVSLFVATAGLGAVLLGVGGSKSGDEARLRQELVTLGEGNVCAAAPPDPRCARVRDTGRAADTLTNAGGWLLIGAGAAGAGTLIYYLLTQSDSPPRVEAAAVITPHHGGGSITLRF